MSMIIDQLNRSHSVAYIDQQKGGHSDTERSTGRSTGKRGITISVVDPLRSSHSVRGRSAEE